MHQICDPNYSLRWYINLFNNILISLFWVFSAIDGAYFGSTFPHLFLMTYGHLKPQPDARGYVPKVFGFKVHKP